MAHFTPTYSPWSFSDTNFVLLGEILRMVGGMPVSEQIRQRIFSFPAGTTSAGWYRS
jgi:CubicO group peptidase (beta-lactamase class C family)